VIISHTASQTLPDPLALEADLGVFGCVEHLFAVDQVFTTQNGLRLDRGRVNRKVDCRLDQLDLIDVDRAREPAESTLDVRDGVVQRGKLDEAVVRVNGP